MQLNALNVNRPKKKRADEPKNLVIRLTGISNDPNQPAFFNGVDVVTNEPVSVRLMTVDEGALANVRANETLEQAKARVNNQYVGTDAKHRPRPAEFRNDKHKVYCAPGGLMMFTKVLPNPDGTFRAHWPETLESQAGAACKKVLAHVSVGEIRDKDNPEKVTASYAYADMLRPQDATILTADNAMSALEAAFQNDDGDVRRNPFVIARLIDASNGSVVNQIAEIRVGAAVIEEEIIDHDLGTKSTARRIGTAEQTLAKIVDPETTHNGDRILRSVLYALSGEEGYPDLSKIEDAAVREDLETIVDAVREGSIIAEVIPGERLQAGPSTKASLIKQIANDKHPLHQYRGKEYLPTVGEDGKESRLPRNVRFFIETYVTTKTSDVGYTYVTKVNAADMSPVRKSSYTLATVNDHSVLTADAAKERVADASAPVAETTGDDWDPEVYMGDGIDDELARSVETVEMAM